MPRKQSTARPTGTIQKFIGSAYDEMKSLADNLDSLLDLEEGMEHTFRYLGPSEGVAPTTRVNGTLIQDGDFYFDTSTDALVYYDEADDVWFEIDPSAVLQANDEAFASALAADTSRIAAETAQTKAEIAQASAETAENNAFMSKGAAEISEIAAGISATTAENYASQTGVDASNTSADVVSADNAASNANSSASAASTHAVNAQNSETAAALSAQQAEQAFDTFDDRYLGTFTVHPTTDNDGDPLQTGATYYNSVDLAVYYWNGAIWESPDKAATDSANAAAASATTATTKAGEAANSATSALTSKTNAAASESASLASKNAAELAEVNAELSETNAKTSEVNSSASELVSKASENSAGVSAASAKEDADRAEQFAAGGSGLTKVAHEVARELRKREYAGSGFAEWGKHRNHASATYGTPINQGIWAYADGPNVLILGGDESVSNVEGESRTAYAVPIVDGVEFTISGTALGRDDASVYFPTAPDGAKSLNPTTGEVHKYHDLAGVGEAYEAYTPNFDDNTWIDLSAVPYNMSVGSQVEFKFKLSSYHASENAYLFGDATNTVYLNVRDTTDVTLPNGLAFAGFTNATLNGEAVSSLTEVIELNVEYHFVAECALATSISAIGTAAVATNLNWRGEIWDIKFEDPALTALGIPPRHYLNADWQSADTDAPDNAIVADRNGYTDKDWTPARNRALITSMVIPTWEYTANDSIEMVVKVGPDLANQYLFDVDKSGPRNAVYVNASGVITASATYTVYVNGVEYADEALVQGNTYHIKIVLTGSSSLFEIGRIGSRYDTLDAFGGEIWDVRLTDNTNPENSRYYPLVINSATQPDTLVAEDAAYDKTIAPFYTPDYNAGQRVDIPEWGGTSDWEFTCNFNLSASTGQQPFYMLYTAENAVNFGIQDSNNTWYREGSGDIAVYIDGVLTDTNTPITRNEDHELRVVCADALNASPIKYIGCYRGISNFWVGRISDIELTDNTDSTNSRFYPSLEYRLDGDTSGTVLRNEQPSIYEATSDLVADGWIPSTGTTVLGNVVTFDSGSAGGGNTADHGLTHGNNYTVEYEITTAGNHGTIQLLNATGGSGSSLPTTSIGSGDGTWTGSWTFTADNFGGAGGIYVRSASGSTGRTITVNSLIIRTPDGQLVNFPVGSEWTLAQVDGATDGTLENFTAGSEWDNDLVTDGTLVGSTLRRTMTLQPAQKCFLEAKYTDFEPIISRKDLVFLETWREKVVGFVRPFGNVQFGGTSHDGVSLVPVTNFVAQGYSAFGEWDENTVGEVADWDSMPTEERAVWASNPKNNLFFDAEDNEYYQESYRIRVVEGINDEPFLVTPKENGAIGSTAMGWFNSGARRIHRQGANTTSSDFDGDFFLSGNHTGNPLMGQPETFVWVGDEGNEIAMPIALVQRLNQGAYHPTYNQGGTAQWGSQVNNQFAFKWYSNDANSNAPMSSTEDCFTWQTENTGGKGSIGGISGRTDQYDFYDAIYAGQVEDLRLNANKQDYARLLTDRVRDGVAGETRGKGKVLFTNFKPTLHTGYYAGTNANHALFNDAPSGGGNRLDTYGAGLTYLTPMMVWQPATGIVGYGTSSSTNGYISFTSDRGNLGERGHTDPTGMSSTDPVYFAEVNELSAEYDSLPWVDIIGDPVRIAATFPDGVVGQWIDVVPAAGVQTFYFNEKNNSGNYQRTYTDDDGSTWTHDANQNINATTNGFDYDSPVNRVLLLQYEALSDFTESDDNRAVEGDVREVMALSTNRVDRGNRLMPSLTGDIATNGQSGTNFRHTSSSPVWGLYWDGSLNGELPTAVSNKPSHYALGLDAPTNDSNAVKALPHLVEKDGLLYVQWHGTQLVYDNTAPNIADGNATVNYSVNERYRIGTTDRFRVYYCISPYNGIASGLIERSDGVLTSLSDTVVFVPCDTYTGSWGDDSEITIVDDEAIKTDLNGNTVKVVTHTEKAPVGIANKNQTL